MQYLQIFADQFKKIKEHPTMTRSPSLLEPMHSMIADQVESHGYKTRSLRNREFTFEGPYGTKDLDVAIFDNNNKLIGAIMFKGIRSEYKKNSNNYFEQMRGESQLLLDGGIPVYQIILIPTKVKHKKSDGSYVWETPSEKSTENYSIYINNNYKPDGLKVGVFYIDVDYENFKANYADRKIVNMENTMTEGIENFIRSLNG